MPSERVDPRAASAATNHESGLSRSEFFRRSGALGAAVLLGGVPDLAAAAASGPPKTPSGTLHVAQSGNSAVDGFDAHYPTNFVEIARNFMMWDTLLYFDENYHVQRRLAEEFTAEAGATKYVIRVRKGVEFSNGKTLTADDVIYSIQRLHLMGRVKGTFINVDPNNITKLDKYTVRLNLVAPDSTIPAAYAQYDTGMVPVGYGGTSLPYQGQMLTVGTGPWILTGNTKFQQSTFTRNKHYWMTGVPHFNNVVMYQIDDFNARLDALLSGQADVIDAVPAVNVQGIIGNRHMKIYSSKKSASNANLSMNLTKPPFTDPRVVQAFKMLANRPEMVAHVFLGYGRVLNDIPCSADPAYIGNKLPQHHYDVAHAKSLLKAAGYSSGLNVTCTIADTGGNEPAAATVFAQNAQAAGVTLNVVTETAQQWVPGYKTYTFAGQTFSTRTFLNQVALSALPGSASNDSNFNNPKFNSLYTQATRTVNPKLQHEIEAEMQRILYNSDGHIVWANVQKIGAYNSTKVTGFGEGADEAPLNSFGYGYRIVYPPKA
jgi:peptide/nickel transport system substrate-binding protein